MHYASSLGTPVSLPSAFFDFGGLSFSSLAAAIAQHFSGIVEHVEAQPVSVPFNSCALAQMKECIRD